MDTKDLLPLLEQLDDDVDDLEEVLQPFLSQSLSKGSKNLPVMDKAKLHVLITYTLESLIFCMRGTWLSSRTLLMISQLICDYTASMRNSTPSFVNSHA